MARLAVIPATVRIPFWADPLMLDDLPRVIATAVRKIEEGPGVKVHPGGEVVVTLHIEMRGEAADEVKVGKGRAKTKPVDTDEEPF